jgi:O-methyltransferase involved in polyketide biosynthesis
MPSTSPLQGNDLQGVSETLFIPLHYRIALSKTPGSGFKDEMAERFQERIAYDWSKFRDAPIFRSAMTTRTKVLDQQVGAFVARHPDALIVNLGAGLDTRFYRLDNGTLRWIELDLPAVVAFRRKLGEPVNARHVLVEGSVLDPLWVARVKQNAGEHVLLIAEGLLPYFTQEQHAAILRMIADNFPGQEMLFQTAGISTVREVAKLVDLRKLSNLGQMSDDVHIQWGLDDAAEVSALEPRARFVEEFPLLDVRMARQQLEQKLPVELVEKLATAGKIVRIRFD